jgi:D-alanyl-D-alanine carboxypeptidase
MTMFRIGLVRGAFLIGTCALALTERGAASPTPAPAPPSFPPATTAAIDKAISSTLSAFNAPGAIVGISIPGRGTYVVAKGVADVATGEPMQVDDHMRIGSVTKSFTGTVLLQLVAEGKVGLDDPVSKYLDFVPNGQNITLRMLADMTAGLFNYTELSSFDDAVVANPERNWTSRELADYGLGAKPYFDPGKGFHYSNTNTVLLGMVIERVTKQDIASVFQTKSFEPLGLTETTWPTNGALPAPFAHGISNSYTPKVVDGTNYSPTISFTAGQLISTVGDLMVWTKACATGSQLTADLQKQRQAWVTFPPLTPQRSYGLGLFLNNGWIGHNGSITGYTSSAFYLPSQGATIVVLVNSDVPVNRVTPADAMFRALAEIVTPGDVPR